MRVSRALNDIKGVGPTIGPPKTERAVRTVSVHDVITVRLVVHLDLYGNAEQPDSLVFRSLRDGPLLNTHFAPQWSRARNEVAFPHVRFHDLRHLASTEAATAGALLRAVITSMGHASSASSLRYLKASESRTARSPRPSADTWTMRARRPRHLP